MGYSQHEKLESFTAGFNNVTDLHHAPVFVLDMDGNCVEAFNLSKQALERYPNGMALKEGESHVQQHLPSGLSREVLDTLLADGTLEPKIFANKPLDVRLPKPLVEAINHRIKAGDLFSISFLTSRDYKDVLYVLRESGVTHPEKVTVVADSGNSIGIDGAPRVTLRPLSPKEVAFKDGVETVVAPKVEARIRSFLGERAPKGDLLRLENKSYGYNLHYRDLLQHLGISNEEDPIAKKIAQIVKEEMTAYASVPDAPVEQRSDGSVQNVFKVGSGPMTYELKLATVTKAMGFHALLEKMASHGRVPSEAIFAGDDSFKHHQKEDGSWVLEGHGTDYYAMMYAKGHECEGVLGTKICKPESVKGTVIHTHHPVGDAVDGTLPSPIKAIPEGHLLHPAQHGGVDLITPTPAHTAGVVVEAIQRMEKSLSQEQAAPGSMVMRLQQQQQQQARAGGGGVGY
jgi:hypothetical protein